jgi:hypothetical protein
MPAVVAAIAFLLALLKVHLGDVNLVNLGLLFLALHFIVPWSPWPAFGPKSGPNP